MNALELKSPLNLERVREYFERNFKGRDFSEDAIPASFYLMGIISGYRRVRIDLESTQVCIDVSQGSNEEFRLQYVGKLVRELLYPVVSPRHFYLLCFSFRESPKSSFCEFRRNRCYWSCCLCTRRYDRIL